MDAAFKESYRQKQGLFAIESGAVFLDQPVVFTNIVVTLDQPASSGLCSKASGAANQVMPAPPELDTSGKVRTRAKVIVKRN